MHEPSPDIRNPARKNSNTKRITHIIKHFTVHLFAKVYTLQALARLVLDVWCPTFPCFIKWLSSVWDLGLGQAENILIMIPHRGVQ